MKRNKPHQVNAFPVGCDHSVKNRVAIATWHTAVSVSSVKLFCWIPWMLRDYEHQSRSLCISCRANESLSFCADGLWFKIWGPEKSLPFVQLTPKASGSCARPPVAPAVPKLAPAGAKITCLPPGCAVKVGMFGRRHGRHGCRRRWRLCLYYLCLTVFDLASQTSILKFSTSRHRKAG